MKTVVRTALRGVGLLLALAAGPLGPGPAAADLLKPGILTVCASTAFAPVLYRDKDGALRGSDVAFLSSFAARRGLGVAFLDFPFDGLWLRPGRDECDVAAAGLTEFESRHSPGVVWSNPYYTVLRTLLIRRDQAARLKTIADFPGKTIGFVRVSSAEFDVRARAPKDAVLKPYDDAGLGIGDLQRGALDAFADGSVTSNYYVAQFPDLAIIDAHSLDPTEGLSFAVREKSGLRDALSRYVDEKAKAFYK